MNGRLTVTVERFTRDGFGDPVPASSHTIRGVTLAPWMSDDRDELGGSTIVGLQMFAPFGSNLRASDVVRVDAGPEVSSATWVGRWDVDGEPGDWQHPTTGRRAGMQAALRRHS